MARRYDFTKNFWTGCRQLKVSYMVPAYSRTSRYNTDNLIERQGRESGSKKHQQEAGESGPLASSLVLTSSSRPLPPNFHTRSPSTTQQHNNTTQQHNNSRDCTIAAVLIDLRCLQVQLQVWNLNASSLLTMLRNLKFYSVMASS